MIIKYQDLNERTHVCEAKHISPCVIDDECYMLVISDNLPMLEFMLTEEQYYNWLDLAILKGYLDLTEFTDITDMDKNIDWLAYMNRNTNAWSELKSLLRNELNNAIVKDTYSKGKRAGIQKALALMQDIE